MSRPISWEYCDLTVSRLTHHVADRRFLTCGFQSAALFPSWKSRDAKRSKIRILRDDDESAVLDLNPISLSFQLPILRSPLKRLVLERRALLINDLLHDHSRRVNLFLQTGSFDRPNRLCWSTFDTWTNHRCVWYTYGWLLQSRCRSIVSNSCFREVKPHTDF